MIVIQAFSLDSVWDTFLRILPKYANSHYYDIMTYFCGFISFLIIMLFKRRYKELNAHLIFQHYSFDVYHRDQPDLKALTIYRIRNLFIPICASLLAMIGFCMIASMSERINLPARWIYVAGLTPIAIYTIFEFLESGILGWIFTIFLMTSISAYNYAYCEENADHHKACYAVRLIMVAFGIIGYLKQFSPPLKSLWKAFRNKKKAAKETTHTEIQSPSEASESYESE